MADWAPCSFVAPASPSRQWLCSHPPPCHPARSRLPSLGHRPCLQPCHRSLRPRRATAFGAPPMAWRAAGRRRAGCGRSAGSRAPPAADFPPSHCRPMRRHCPLRRRLVRRSPSLPRLRTQSPPSPFRRRRERSLGANLPARADGGRPAGCATRAWPGSTAAAVLGVVGRARGGQDRQCGTRELPRISSACHSERGVLLLSVNAERCLLSGACGGVQAIQVIDRGHALAAKLQNDVERLKAVGCSLASRRDGEDERLLGSRDRLSRARPHRGSLWLRRARSSSSYSHVPLRP